jgi:hypothetical protein
VNDSRSHPLRRRSQRAPASATDQLPVAPRMFLTLAAEGGEQGEDQRSPVRTGFVLFISILVLLGAPLYWTASAQGGDQDEPQAVAVKSEDDDGDEDEDEDDNTGTGGNDSGTGGNDPGTKAETQKPGPGPLRKAPRPAVRPTRATTPARQSVARREPGNRIACWKEG